MIIRRELWGNLVKDIRFLRLFQSHKSQQQHCMLVCADETEKGNFNNFKTANFIIRHQLHRWGIIIDFCCGIHYHGR